MPDNMTVYDDPICFACWNNGIEAGLIVPHSDSCPVGIMLEQRETLLAGRLMRPAQRAARTIRGIRK